MGDRAFSVAFFSNSQGKRADWSPGRAFIDGLLLAKTSYFPFWSLLRLSVLYLVFLASHITRTYWLPPENLSNLANYNIYITLLFFQYLGSPKGKKNQEDQKGESGLLFCLLREQGPRYHFLLPPLLPEISQSPNTIKSLAARCQPIHSFTLPVVS